MHKLPIEDVLTDVKKSLHVENNLVLQAPTGAGKSTLLPLSLLNETFLGSKKIILLEPRRLATRTLAKRMAYLLDEKVGERVGYIIKNERLVSSKTKLIVVTEGVLTQMLQHDPSLEEIALIIFDEFHERNLHADLALALSLESQMLLREDLKIIVMSATINTQSISKLLYDAPIIVSKGRSFNVEIRYLRRQTKALTSKTLLTHITKIVLDSVTKNEGSILIFLPGIKEIKALEERLHVALKSHDISIATLYANLSKELQDSAISASNKTKIVIATNIAESSLSIEGIKVVIDSGLEKVSHFNPSSGMNSLITSNISQESATQRSGRAGRMSEGVCYRLWHEHSTRIKHKMSEIQSSDLSTMMLELAQWGANDIYELQWLDLPKSSAIKHAQDLLHQLGALHNNIITPHGKKMLSLSTHPRLAHMMLKAKELSFAHEAAILAAILSEKDIINSSRYSCDITHRFEAVSFNNLSEHINHSALKQVKKTLKEFEHTLQLSPRKSSLHVEILGTLLAFAYPDRVAQIRDKNSANYLLSSAKGAYLNTQDELFNSEYLVVAKLDALQANAKIQLALPIKKEELLTYHKDNITHTQLTHFSDEFERVESKECTLFGAIILKEKALQKADEEQILSTLLEAIKSKGLSVFTFSKEAKALQSRVNFLHYHSTCNTKIADISPLNNEYLLENLHLWLAPYLSGINSFKACKKLDIYSILLHTLSYEQQQLLENLAPAKIKVPSGSSLYINYEDPSTPTLAVRLQEMFGMIDTPTLLDGSVVLSIELLSPAYRAMQITKDLRSFWKSTYFEIKKELQVKYKKHYWPDNPLEAKATNRTKKYM